MKSEYFDWVTAAFATISAILWFLSARVNFAFGYDMDAQLNAAMSKASRLNAWAAAIAALATIAQVVKPVLPLYT